MGFTGFQPCDLSTGNVQQLKIDYSGQEHWCSYVVSNKATFFYFIAGVPKKSSRVFQLFSKNTLSQNGKIGLGSNRFFNEYFICMYLNLVKCPDKVLETNR